ncbi:MAG: molecular chaperone HtpG [Peptococcaceae bacterium]|nr:molecular chaperone HtpG [Peptococcaceae bacterium]
MSNIEQHKPEKLEFQAEVSQMLDIVINSLYTERDIFVRELISNASDALEKLRLISLTEDNIIQKELPLEINIETDDNNKTFIISDTGIGMSREELISNLGTIAHSGSREFIKGLAEGEQNNTQLIGQFGVGFYAAFMAGAKVTVQSLSYREGSLGWEWSSEGVGSYTVTEVDGLQRGTRIIVTLKEDAHEYADSEKVKRIVQQYSNFIPFDIKINGEKINTVQAIWSRNKNEVSDEEYNEFYKYFTNSYSDPMFRLHISSDAPLQLNALLYIPADNPELYGMGHLEPGVSIYSRKVLIDQKSTDIFPEYFRFIKGVVDSEDLPLNISRETAQNSILVKKMRKYLTKRVLTFIEKQSEDKEKYGIFWSKFSRFIKEGCVNDPESRESLAKLLRFNSSKKDNEELISLEEYVAEMKEGQTDIYYINCPSRELIESGPYLEIFREKDIEVLYLHEPVDDFVISALYEYRQKKFVSADQADLDLFISEGSGEGSEVLNQDEIFSLAALMKEIIGDSISEVRESKRLLGSPAMLVNSDQTYTTAMQRVLKAAESGFSNAGSKILEINPRHQVIIKLAKFKESGSDLDFLRSCIEQIADNAFLSAGLTDRGGLMIERIYKIMNRALDSNG